MVEVSRLDVAGKCQHVAGTLDIGGCLTGLIGHQIVDGRQMKDMVYVALELVKVVASHP